MATSNINRVVLTGNLTRDPVLRNTSSGTPVCGLRIASNTRRKTSGGEWVDKPNYFSVTVWGALGENCHRYLAKGRQVAIDGRLDWHEWEAQDGTRRESVDIVADSVQFLGGAPDANGNHDGAVAPSDPEPVAAGGVEYEDDIPFRPHPAQVEPTGSTCRTVRGLEPTRGRAPPCPPPPPTIRSSIASSRPRCTRSQRRCCPGVSSATSTPRRVRSTSPRCSTSLGRPASGR